MWFGCMPIPWYIHTSTVSSDARLLTQAHARLPIVVQAVRSFRQFGPDSWLDHLRGPSKAARTLRAVAWLIMMEKEHMQALLSTDESAGVRLPRDDQPRM